MMWDSELACLANSDTNQEQFHKITELPFTFTQKGQLSTFKNKQAWYVLHPLGCSKSTHANTV